ncbi:type II toxin-antitoxin system VapC family toxin [Rhodobium gokarnense]|uniref:Ribonuclease VapC n=1 Tax=Rhodobium gokarnense TaxID=364296 RepID=A0ABT3HEC9_9HYPH|nr:PIN domain-containing protein [Rhodobium gokarnense]MCW2308751.1 putative nucleic acid-binding protein [Rhodobium gokarnense]
MTEGVEPPIYLDTNVFIYALEGAGDAAVPAQRLIEYLRENEGRGVTSELTLAEAAFSKRLTPREIERQRQEGKPPRRFAGKRSYYELLLSSGVVTLEPVSRAVLEETIELRQAQSAKVKLPDAIHLATAVLSRCRYFVTGDKQIRVPGQMTKLDVFGELSEMIERDFH